MTGALVVAAMVYLVLGTMVAIMLVPTASRALPAGMVLLFIFGTILLWPIVAGSFWVGALIEVGTESEVGP